MDALRVVSEGVNRAKESSNMGVLLITHYTRILRYIRPDFVHVFVDGRIAHEGGPELGRTAGGRGVRPIRRRRRQSRMTSVAPERVSSAQPFSPAESAAIRADFPLLQRTVRDGRPLVYLDSGAASRNRPPCWRPNAVAA